MKIQTRQSRAPRTYRMVARAAAADATRLRILEAARREFAGLPYEQVSLRQVAQQAGVTVQTVLRRFGSKEALFAAVAAWRADSIARECDAVVAGDVAGAVGTMVESYERWGDEVLELLAEEQRSPIIREVTTAGRRYHHAWVERVFAPGLRRAPADQRERRQALLIAALDVYFWKVLRRDLGLPQETVKRSLLELIDRIL
jgi:AcrR family transcriptional regulator